MNAKKESILILGDSIPEHVDGRNMSRYFNGKKNVFVKSFSGSTINNMYDFSRPFLEKEPDLVILHIGANNIRSEK